MLMSYLEPGSVLTWKDMKQEPGQLGFVSVNFIVSETFIQHSNIVSVEVGSVTVSVCLRCPAQRLWLH